MKEYTGHHSCSKNGGLQFVKENAPFFSQLNENNKQLPYLGAGYYFWDYDLKQAQQWGKTHYHNSYYVLEGTIGTTDETFLDLAGDRKHMEHFMNLMETFAKKAKLDGSLRMGKFIEILKRIDKYRPGTFPFLVIRAQDYSAMGKKTFRISFNQNDSFTYLSPRHIFCLYVINDVTLPTKRIIFES